jgi:hypothetical protein
MDLDQLTPGQRAVVDLWLDGLRVWDQWRGHRVAQRTIRFKGGQNNTPTRKSPELARRAQSLSPLCR